MESGQNKEQSQDDNNIELDLVSHGGIEVTQGGSKPLFEKVITAMVNAAVLMTTKDRKEDKDKQGNSQIYYPVYLKVTYNVEGKEFFENYGGGKLYISETSGEKKFWVGDSSALGKLLGRIKDQFDYKGTLAEIPSLIFGRSVGIMTETSTVQGNEYKKNVIQHFK